MSAKDKKSEVFSYFKKVKCEFLARKVILFLWTKGFETHIRICVNANVCMLERTRGSRLLCALYMLCPGSAVSWNRRHCNRQSMQRVQNTWSIGTGLCLMFGHKCSFPNSLFLILVRNKKRSSGIDGKTSDCLSRNCLYSITVILSYVSVSNYSLKRLNLWLLFFRWFPHGKSAACKKLPD